MSTSKYIITGKSDHPNKYSQSDLNFFELVLECFPYYHFCYDQGVVKASELCIDALIKHVRVHLQPYGLYVFSYCIIDEQLRNITLANSPGYECLWFDYKLNPKIQTLTLNDVVF